MDDTTPQVPSAAMPPRDFPGLRDLIVAQIDRLPKRLAQVAHFAVTHPDEVALGTAASLAEKVDVQPSTLVRFAKVLGYQGFSEFQSVFRERLRGRSSSYDDRLRSVRSHTDPGAQSAQLFEGFCQAALRSLGALRSQGDPEKIEAAARRLAAADTIYLIAQRRAFPVSAYLSYAFGTLGIKSVLVSSAAGTEAETLSFATEKDAALAVSFTPYSPATLAHVRQVTQRRAPLVVITDSPFSPLAAAADLWFEVVEADYEGFRSLSATMTLAICLAVAVAEIKRTPKMELKF
jgi:DNA-binding MurR/RpiR family transcriptional regulator